MSYLDENGLKKVLGKLKNWVEEKVSSNKEAADIYNDLANRLTEKEDKRKYMIVGSVYGEDLYKYENYVLDVRKSSGKVISLDRINSTDNISNVSIIFKYSNNDSVHIPSLYRVLYKKGSKTTFIPGCYYEIHIDTNSSNEVVVDIQEYSKQPYTAEVTYNFPTDGKYEIGNPGDIVLIDNTEIKLAYDKSYYFTAGEHTITYLGYFDSFYNNKFNEYALYITKFKMNLGDAAYPIYLEYTFNKNKYIEEVDIDVMSIASMNYAFTDCTKLNTIIFRGYSFNIQGILIEAKDFTGIPNTGMCYVESSNVYEKMKEVLPSGWTVEYI